VSPDGQQVSFAVWDGKLWTLKVASLADGVVRTLTDRLSAIVADWGPDEQLYFKAKDEALWRISATGGEPELMAVPDSARGELRYGHSGVLPSGTAVLLSIGGTGELGLLDIQSREVESLGVEGLYPQYLSGYVIYRNDVEGAAGLYAIPFDVDRLEVTGEARRLPFVPRMEFFGGAHFAVSPNGELVYVSTERRRTDMVWVTRDGTERRFDPDSDGVLYAPRISPDGTLIVGEWRVDGRGSIATLGVDGGQPRPISFAERNPHSPSWHPDGTRVTFPASGPGQVVASLDGRPSSRLGIELDPGGAIWSPDGQWFVMQAGGFGIQDLFIRHTHPDSVARPLIVSDRSDLSPSISPDGRYLAYQSDAAGQSNIVVRPFPNVDDDRVQVSFNGGYSPVWSGDGRELFYRDRTGSMIAALVETAGAFSVTGQEPLFSGAGYEVSTSRRRYDVHPDGERFLMVRRRGDELILVHNWIEELRAFMGESN
jgi:eukaryotic-like serine/threonine-protein kinase